MLTRDDAFTTAIQDTLRRMLDSAQVFLTKLLKDFIMVLSIINREIENYKKFIVSQEYDELYKWETLKNFHDNWDIESNDFKAMYDKSFYSNHLNNLWANPHWFPKSVMQRFIEYDQERVREMFRGLFNETENIDKRIERFVYHCDRIREEIFENDKSVKSHFHDGLRIVSLYLAFRYPEEYAIYKFTEFKNFMTLVKASNIPGTGEHERFFKVVKTLYNILHKDEALVKLHNTLLRDDCYKGKSLMLAQDFIFVTARRKENKY